MSAEARRAATNNDYDRWLSRWRRFMQEADYWSMRDYPERFPVDLDVAAAIQRARNSMDTKLPFRTGVKEGLSSAGRFTEAQRMRIMQALSKYPGHAWVAGHSLADADDALPFKGKSDGVAFARGLMHAYYPVRVPAAVAAVIAADNNQKRISATGDYMVILSPEGYQWAQKHKRIPLRRDMVDVDARAVGVEFHARHPDRAPREMRLAIEDIAKVIDEMEDDRRRLFRMRGSRELSAQIAELDQQLATIRRRKEALEAALAMELAAQPPRTNGAAKNPPPRSAFAEHPWWYFSRWESSDYTDREAAKEVSRAVGFDVAAKFANPDVDQAFWSGEIEEIILNEYGNPEGWDDL
jgi:hypothetical protein